MMFGKGYFIGIHGIHGILKEHIVDITDFSAKNLLKLYNTPTSGFSGTSRIKSLTKNLIGGKKDTIQEIKSSSLKKKNLWVLSADYIF